MNNKKIQRPLQNTYIKINEIYVINFSKRNLIKKCNIYH